MIDKALQLVEEAFSTYLMDNCSSSTLEKKLSVAFGSITSSNGTREFEVVIVKNRDFRNFFGMNVFPQMEYLDKICNSVVQDDITYKELVKKWRKIDKWVITIDSLCFDRNFINFNPKELTALALHEVGHVTQSDKAIEQFYRAYLESSARMRAAQKVSKKFLYILYMIPLAVAARQRIWIGNDNSIKLEIAADRTLLDTGYTEHLISALDKVIKVAGNDSIMDDETKYKEILSSVDWCNINIADIVKRRNKMKDELYYIGIRSNSPYIKALCGRILDTLGVRMRERYTGAVSESCMLAELSDGVITLESHEPIFDIKVVSALEANINSIQQTPAIEGFFNRRKKRKIDLPSNYDLDRIAIEIDKIDNNHDRIYVLDLIYDNLERISDFEEAIATNPTDAKKWASQIEDMRKRLDVLRKVVLDKKITQKEYKLWVKVPEEYEG